MTALQDPRRTQLRRTKALALGLLFAMLAGFVVSHALGGQGAWAWTGAFCEAATVGALADWFAVTALFRRPLGLPIPHTAIVPRNKPRIGEQLARFVRDHFLTTEMLLARLRVFDPAARLGQWLAEPAQARAASDAVRRMALEALAMLDEGAVRGAIQRFVVERLRGWDAAATVGEVLALLTRDGRHQTLFDEALRRLGAYLDQAGVKERAAELMVRYARREWPRIVGTVNMVKPVDGIAGQLAERLARALLDEMQDVLTDPAHMLRQDYERWLADYIERLRDDPALKAQIDDMKRRAIDHPQLQAYVQGIWDEIRLALGRDLEREDSALGRHLEQALSALGARLGADGGLREALNAHVLSAAASLAERLREGITTHIAQTVARWDERQLVEALELSVGRDLQYVRFSGTLVGGAIGLLLHALITLLPV